MQFIECDGSDFIFSFSSLLVFKMKSMLYGSWKRSFSTYKPNDCVRKVGILAVRNMHKYIIMIIHVLNLGGWLEIILHSVTIYSPMVVLSYFWILYQGEWDIWYKGNGGSTVCLQSFLISYVLN